MTVTDPLPFSFHEGDENGHVYTVDQDDADPSATHPKGACCVLYVDYPEHTLSKIWSTDDSPWAGWTLTETEQQLFIPWIEKRHPKISFVDTGDDNALYGEIYGEYEENDSTERLLYRMCVVNAAWTNLRNEWEILFTGFHAFMEYIRELRKERADKWWEEIEDDEVSYASDVSTSVEDLVLCPYVVVIEDDQSRRWVIGCKSDHDIAAQYAECMLSDDNEWVDGVYHFGSAEPYEHNVTTTLTISVNNDEFTHNGSKES